MTIKCPHCGASLKYDPSSQDLFCDACGSFITKDQITIKEEPDEMTYETVDTYDGSDDSGEQMECKLYHCKSCGAELIINGVESATFCAYCGQPTIVFDRISKQRKPSYIVPFTVTKEEALATIRKKIDSGRYIPDGIKHFKVDMLRGIYVPFWLFDVKYHDFQKLSGKVRSGKNTHTYHYLREGEAQFENITVDASKSFADNSSQRLEPYDLHAMKDFEIAYLSGFYADCSDESMEVMKHTATMRAKQLFDAEIAKTIKASDIKIESSVPQSSVEDATYVMLPAWFMVFHQGSETYTILVNGQTGKMVGALPVDTKLATMHFLLLGTVFTGLLTPVFTFFLKYMSGDDIADIPIAIMVAAFFALVAGFKKLKDLKTSQQLTSAQQIKKYAADRQEEGE